MNIDAALSAVTQPLLEETVRERRRCFWFGLAIVWALALVFLQYGLIDRLAAPPSERVNNGRHATFFAVHVNPYYEFSEDFHLYVVRAKRIAQRGWTNSPLYGRDGEQPYYTAALQVGLMQLAALTDGRPVPYACFIVAVLAASWTVMAVAADRCYHRTISPLTVPIAVGFTVLFESVALLVHAHTDYGQWPMQFGMRMATLAWSRPLLAATLLAAISLIFQPARPIKRAAFIAVMTAVFATSDVWTLILAGSCLGVVVALLAIQFCVERYRGQPNSFDTLKALAAVVMASAIGVAVYLAASTPFTGDALTRAGFGPQWKQSPWRHNAQQWTVERFRDALPFALVLGAAVLTSIQIRLAGGWRDLECRVAIGLPSPRRWYYLLMALVPCVGLLVATGLMGRMGMEAYHAEQFVWRVNFLLLFAATTVASEFAKLTIRFLAAQFRVPSIPWEFAGAAALLAGLVIYHAARTYEFIARMPAREFFLTESEERLGEWLRNERPADERYLLATTSHELNYLCAYWTNADLLLPEGFPYHCQQSQAALERRTAQLLAVYRATPQRWLEFNLHRAGSDQWDWAASRLLSAREGYLYYLMHRGVGVEGSLVHRYQSPAPPRTTLHIADQRLHDEDYLNHGDYRIAEAGYQAAQRIAELLRSNGVEPARPDVIVIDETSRFLGTPGLAAYRRAFQHGDLEAWVRK